jgi:hypothetical protein
MKRPLFRSYYYLLFTHRLQTQEEIMKRILIALLCLSAVRLPAQTLTWSTPVKYGTGEQSSVSMNSSGLVVEVHKSRTSNTLFYHVGKLNRSIVFSLLLGCGKCACCGL